MAAASQLWYVPHRPDLILLSPCDGEDPLPCPGSMFVSVDHMHQPARGEVKWRHPRASAFLTCFGDIARQQPRVVRCACGTAPCALRSLEERGGVPDGLIPQDWATRYELPPQEPAPAGEASEGRRASAVQLWLECTARAEKEIPSEAGQDGPPEAAVLAAAEVMLSDYLKGRVCFHCSVPSTRMMKCSRCLQARYCSKECQRAHWVGGHKAECGGAGPGAGGASEAAAAAAAAVGALEAAAAAPESVAVASG